MFQGLDAVAFWVYRLCDRQGFPYVLGNYAWAVAVRTGFPNYTEIWGFRKEVAA